MANTRPWAVAGAFYPRDPQQLEQSVIGYLDQATTAKRPFKGLIVPHAGYIYSGAVAAQAFNLLRGNREISRVILMGPAHYEPVVGIAMSSCDSFTTPLGSIRVDTQSLSVIESLPWVHYGDHAHAPEHCLEVQLPFLHFCLTELQIIPLLVGGVDAQQVGEVLKLLWGGSETLIVISSDLSHYQSYAEAQVSDRDTSAKICSQSQNLVGSQACGCRAINGLMNAINGLDMQVQELDLRNSGDTAGGKDRVVGYGAYAIVDR